MRLSEITARYLFYAAQKAHAAETFLMPAKDPRADLAPDFRRDFSCLIQQSKRQLHPQENLSNSKTAHKPVSRESYRF